MCAAETLTQTCPFPPPSDFSPSSRAAVIALHNLKHYSQLPLVSKNSPCEASENRSQALIGGVKGEHQEDASFWVFK